MRYETRQKWRMRWRARRTLRRHRHDIAAIERYCMFLGYPRSGHSLVGALLTAHPEMVVAHELDTLRWFEHGLRRDELLALCIARDRWFAKRDHEWTGYSYHVKGADQGRWDRLRVVGDKKGGRTAMRLGERPDLIERLQEEIALPFRVIHVVRNPYDNIATMYKKGDGSLEHEVERYFGLADTNLTALRALDQDEVFHLYQEALVARPKDALKDMTGFLGVEAAADYLDRCASIVFQSPRQRRFSIEWPERTRERVQQEIDRRPHLRGYTFEDPGWPTDVHRLTV